MRLSGNASRICGMCQQQPFDALYRSRGWSAQPITCQMCIMQAFICAAWLATCSHVMRKSSRLHRSDVDPKIFRQQPPETNFGQQFLEILHGHGSQNNVFEPWNNFQRDDHSASHVHWSAGHTCQWVWSAARFTHSSGSILEMTSFACAYSHEPYHNNIPSSLSL